MSLKPVINKLDKGENLTEEQMIKSMTLIMEGHAETDDLILFLKALSQKGETIDEITGAARVMREKALPVDAPYDSVDCCGTGGDQKGTYNISTAVALVAAACGVPVAKHGNRAASSRSGAADVLEVMGVNLSLPQTALEEALEDFCFCFLMAPAHHSAMRHVAEARRKIGKRTIFNILGPLANPAGTRLQLLGVYDQKWLRPMAETLKNLDSKRAWIVHGADGLDEISVSGPTHIAKLDQDGEIQEETLTPENFGLSEHPIESILGGDAEDNAKALRALLEGKKDAYRDIVLANAAAVLVVHGSAADLKQGIEKATEAIDSGFALENFTDYITFSRSIDDAL